MAGEKGGTLSRTANRLQYDMANHLADVSAASTADYLLGFDVSAVSSGWTPRRYAGNDIRTMQGMTVQSLAAGATATAVQNKGYVELTSASAKTYEIAAGSLTPGAELWMVSHRSSGTANVAVSGTAAGVTLNGTADTVTFNANGEALHLVAKTATQFIILENIGSAALS